ncbi:unnamed protein product [Rotaria sordida]|uniref:Protein phosphatase n=1 Tax=Rotaria sordida TaxID=392033 RepID=A0A815LVK1_9BILA|nr:unnamed protein product [Rotaria sordida]CAF4027030.1 unnamed protein product [Rotaria sordida]
MSGVNIQIINSTNIDKNIYKLSACDIRNLTYYLHVQSHPFINIENIGKNDQENMSVGLDLNKKSTKNSQPLTDTYRIHHNYRPNSQRRRPYTKHVPDKPKISLSLDPNKKLCLEIATCGMKKNTRLPVPHKNFSLIDGCFGDDAGFIIQKDQRNFLGISDGAGGNLMYGYNPRLFSESLMRNCSDLAHTGKYCTSQPKRLLCHAFDRVQTENCFGSATACVIGIDCTTGRLCSVNIGDSGFVIVRQGCVIYRSRSQAMDGDCPRQLDVYPWTASLKGHGINYTQISSLDAICDTFDVQLDDIIILSTDGLFDNVPNFLIEKILSQNHSLKKSANDLVTRAVRYYVKPDDILVIMARITSINNSISKQSK